MAGAVVGAKSRWQPDTRIECPADARHYVAAKYQYTLQDQMAELDGTMDVHDVHVRA